MGRKRKPKDAISMVYIDNGFNASAIFSYRHTFTQTLSVKKKTTDWNAKVISQRKPFFVQ